MINPGPTPKKKGKKIGHTSTNKGKRVLLFFHNNSTPLLTKFLDKKGRFIVTTDGKFSTEEVYKVAIYRNKIV